MFLIRSMYLKKILENKKNFTNEAYDQNHDLSKTIIENQNLKIKNTTVDQIKNIEQEEKIVSTQKVKSEIEYSKIENLKDLIVLCEKKKELKIKYEIENNLRLVSFKDQKIEISFNSTLDKTFIKELSSKLLEWTNKRWIIAFSKEDGLPTLKDQKKDLQKNLVKKESVSKFSDEVKKIFPDAELLKVEEDNKK